MECRFDVVIEGDEDVIGKLSHLLNIDLAPAAVDAKDAQQFLAACLKYGQRAGQTAGQALLDALSRQRAGWRLRMTSCRELDMAFSAQYGSCGEDVAAALAAFLASFPLACEARIEGDYDEDADGFSFTVRGGQVLREDGILARDGLPADRLQLPPVEIFPSEAALREGLAAAEDEAAGSAEYRLAVGYCERRGIDITPGFRKKTEVARYAIVRTDTMPPRLMAVSCDRLSGIDEFVLTNLGTVADCGVLVLDTQDRLVLKPVYDEAKLREALADAAVGPALPLRASQYLELSPVYMRGYLSLTPVGPLD